MYLIINTGDFTLDNQVLIADGFGQIVENSTIPANGIVDYVMTKLEEYSAVDKIKIIGFEAQTLPLKDKLSTTLELYYSNKSIEIEVL